MLVEAEVANHKVGAGLLKILPILVWNVKVEFTYFNLLQEHNGSEHQYINDKGNQMPLMNLRK